MNASQPTMWLAADYHLPSTYSYRMPMSSMAHAPTLPTPGPATVRLALLRRSLELFGEAMTRETLFPILREMLVRIRPPESVAISPHLLRASKWSEERRARHPHVQESLMLREVAHAKGLLTIYLQIPASAETRFRAVLQAIGYWGQTDSFACRWCFCDNTMATSSFRDNRCEKLRCNNVGGVPLVHPFVLQKPKQER